MVGDDPAVDRILVFYDQAADSGRGGSWAAVREGIRLGAADAAAPVLVSSTLPELLDEGSALEFMEAGVPAVAGLRTGLACAAALGKPAGDPARLRDIAATAVRARPRRATGSAGSRNMRRRSYCARPVCPRSRAASSMVRMTRLSRSRSSAVTSP